jgi:GNAT superfamily N-acetyltransferase
MRNNTATINVRRATFGDLTGAAGVLAAAFQDDPVFAWCLPDAARRAAIGPSFFRIVANAIAVHDEIRVAAPSGAIEGAALWLPPGAEPVDDLESAFSELLGDDAGRTFDLVGLLDAAHPHAPHDNLWFVGVAPAAQGHGIGSALLGQRPDHPAYVVATSTDNRRLYERHGFEVVNELRVGTSPTLWAMWRDT